MSITITKSNIVSAVKQHLSSIGKRLYDKEGKNMFSNITLSSAEDSLLNQYIESSVQDVEAVLKQFISASSYSTSITLTISNTRGDSDFETRTTDLIKSYATLNSVAEYLSMFHPDIASKYQRDAQQRMEMLVAYVFYKKPIVNEVSGVTDPTGGVS